MKKRFAIRAGARARDADPEDLGLRWRVVQQRARIAGPDAYRDLFRDRRFWQSEDTIALQDWILARVSAGLAPRYAFLGARRYACNGQAHRIARFRHQASGIEFHLIPGGAFHMGADGSYDNEAPRHKVRIREPFLLGRFPLRHREWEVFGSSAGPRRRGLDLPVGGISWDRAKAWLNAAGDGLRLPSESEWEYAARSGTRTRFFWGDAVDNRYVWYWNNSGQRAHSVLLHSERFNAFGLVDMVGNVQEWCEDDYILRYDQGPETEQPRRRSGHTQKVWRGASYSASPSVLHLSRRAWLRPTWSPADQGLRLAADLPVIDFSG